MSAYTSIKRGETPEQAAAEAKKAEQSAMVLIELCIDARCGVLHCIALRCGVSRCVVLRCVA